MEGRFRVVTVEFLLPVADDERDPQGEWAHSRAAVDALRPLLPQALKRWSVQDSRIERRVVRED